MYCSAKDCTTLINRELMLSGGPGRMVALANNAPSTSIEVFVVNRKDREPTVGLSSPGHPATGL